VTITIPVRVDTLNLQVADNKAVLEAIQQLGVSMATTLQEIKDELAQIKSGVQTANAKATEQIALIAELRAQLEGQPALQQALDEIDALADDVIAAQGGTPALPPDQV
jgi:uncharacterized protein involved in exopolysaccharide biosynthesis